MREILATGASGLVGSRFTELTKGKYSFITPEYPEFDMTDKRNIEKHLMSINPQVIINFAAYTNVSEAEDQRGNKNADCWRINVDGVENIINVMPSNCHFIHISTDMVFPGSKEFPGPYKEGDEPEKDPNKVTWYGYSKGEAERRARKLLGKNFTILRLIYPFRSHYDQRSDYVRKPLKLYDDGELYALFDDQQVSVTFVDSLVPVLARIIDERVEGVYHAGSEDTTTPSELVSYLLWKARGVKNVVVVSSIDSVKNPVRYPKYGGLDVTETEKKLGVKLGTYKEMIDEFTQQLGG